MTEQAKNKGHRWKKGESGNPRGRALGSRSKSTLAAEAILRGGINAVAKKVLSEAKSGAPWACRVIVDKLVPTARSRPVFFDMGKVEGPADIVRVLTSVAREVAKGEITTLEAAEIGTLLDALRQAHEVANLVEDVEQLKLKVAALTGNGT